MNKLWKPLAIALLVTLILQLAACVTAPFALTLVPRQFAVRVALVVYEMRGGHVPDIHLHPFVDAYDHSAVEQAAIAQAWAVGITSGTSDSTFAPDDPTELYMWFLFLGRAMMLSK